MLYVSSYAVSDVSRLGFVSCNAYTRTHARASYVFQYSQDGRLLDFKNLTRFYAQQLADLLCKPHVPRLVKKNPKENDNH